MARRHNDESCIPNTSVAPTMLDTSTNQLPDLSSSTTTTTAALSTPETPSVTTYRATNDGLILKSPDTDCTGYYVDTHCIPLNFWMTMYFALSPANDLPGPLNIDSIPGVLLQGPQPDGKCDGYRINGKCLNQGEFQRLLKTLTTLYPTTRAVPTTIAPSTTSPNLISTSSMSQSEEEISAVGAFPVHI